MQRLLEIFLVCFIWRIKCESVSDIKQLIEDEVKKLDGYENPTDASKYRPHNCSVKDFGAYDFVIVGASPAGSVIANRLSEIKKWKILLLEAGDVGNEFTSIPAVGWASLLSDYNWGYFSVPQKHGCQGLVEKRCPYPRGRGVGGTALTGGLVYSRSNQIDYNRWASMGNKGWSYKEVLPYFKKSENFYKNIENAYINWDYHNTGGLWDVQFSPMNSSLSYVFIDANEELGYNITDYSSNKQLGASFTQVNLKNGRRADPGTAFVVPILNNRTNFKLSTQSYVTKIDIRKDRKAAGVFFSKGGQIYYAKAKKEVIVSAGAINSPHLLMLSGIGPKKHLKEVGVRCIKDLEVGSAFRDHIKINMFTSYNGTKETTTFDEDVEDFLNGTGPLTSLNPDSIAFYHSKLEQTENYPDLLEFTYSPYSSPYIPEVSNVANRFTNETLSGLAPPKGTTTFSTWIVGLNTTSKGTIRLKSKDPYAYPLIDPNLLSDPEDHDLNLMYEGVQLLQTVLQTDAYRKINATLLAAQLPACSQYEDYSKDYWLCFIKQISIAPYHPLATCPMGPERNKNAVVDDKLRVHGIRSLRVADASIFPTNIAGHPTATCVMIGEKVSDLIKNLYLN